MRYLCWEQCLARTDQAAAQLRRKEYYVYALESKTDGFHYVTEHPSSKKIPHVHVLSRHISVAMTNLLV